MLVLFSRVDFRGKHEREMLVLMFVVTIFGSKPGHSQWSDPCQSFYVITVPGCLHRARATTKMLVLFSRVDFRGGPEREMLVLMFVVTIFGSKPGNSQWSDPCQVFMS